MDELQKAREELLRELDKGIGAMEQGDVIPCDEAIRKIREKYGGMYRGSDSEWSCMSVANLLRS